MAASRGRGKAARRFGAVMRFSIFSVNDHHPRLARTVPELYQQVMHQCELSEALGYDTFFCAEHHFHEYGVVPDPAVMLSALAQRTRRVRLGTAIDRKSTRLNSS